MDDRPTPPPPPSDWDAWPAGYLIPRSSNRVVRALGKGGMGIVYEVENERDGARLAVKAILRHHTRDRDAIKRLQFEVQIMRSLPLHSGLPAVVGELDRTPDGVAWFAMELLEGLSLRDTLRRRKQLPPPRAAWLTLEVLGALSVVHRAGYVHRDVKPNNIFVTTNDRVVLLDFGVAKALFDAPGKPSTSKGQLPGTASYMSPEYLNEAKALSPQFDVYAAGLVLWECITGRAAFANKNFMQTTHAIVNAGVPSLEEMGFDWLPWDFRAVVKSATAKDPRDRYPTVDAFAARLREAVPLLGSLPPAPVRASHPDLRRSVETRPDVARLSDPPSVPGPNDEAPKETNEPDSSSGAPSSKPSDEGEATEVRLPAMTGFLPVQHDRAQEVPLVLVHAPDSEHSTSLAMLDEATVHRAELSAYLSTVDPFGGTAPDATAFVADAHYEDDSALVATITLTLRSADEAGVVHEPPDDGTALDVLNATAAPNKVAGADEDGMASSVDRLPAFGPVVRAFDGSTVDGSIALSDLVAEAADVPASQPVVGSSDRVAADQDDDDPDRKLFGSRWPLYLPASGDLMMPPRPTRRLSRAARLTGVKTVGATSGGPQPALRRESNSEPPPPATLEGRRAGDDFAAEFQSDPFPPGSEEKRFRELLPDMETNLRPQRDPAHAANDEAAIAVPAPAPAPARRQHALRRFGGGVAAALSRALVGTLRPLGLAVAEQAMRLLGAALELAAGRRPSRPLPAALPAPAGQPAVTSTAGTGPDAPQKEREQT